MKLSSSKRFIGLIGGIILVLALVSACAPEAALPTEPTEPAVEPIVLGAPASLGTVAYNLPNAAKLAAEEINAAGGVLVDGVRRPLEIVTTDTRDLEPAIPIHDVVLAYKDLISREKPDALVAGPIRSEAMLSVMENLAEDKIVHIFSGGVSPTFMEFVKEDYEKYKYFFKNSPSAMDLGMGLFSVMSFVQSEFGYNTVFFLTEDVDFARATEAGMSALLPTAGWEVKGSVHTPLGMTDYSAALQQLKDSGADVGFYVYSSEASPLARQYQTMNISGLLVGVCDPLGGPKAWEATEGAVKGMINIISGAGNVPVPAMPKTVEFQDRYFEKYGELPQITLGCSQSYDAVYILAEAIEQANSLDSDKLVTALEATDYAGVVGRTRFDAVAHNATYGFDPAEAAIVPVIQWLDGERVPVFPESIAETEIQPAQ